MDFIVEIIAVCLTVTFLVLKASGTIDWSYWVVLAPVWVYLGLQVLLFLFAVIVGSLKAPWEE